MPPGAGFTIPRLEFGDSKPIPAEYRIIQGERAAAQLALNLLEAGVLSGEDWGASQGDPLTFLHRGLECWLDSNGREQVQQQFFLDVALSTSLDRFSYRSEPCEENLATVFLTIEPDSAGYVVLGPTLRLLDQVHPRLPATFLHLFLGALNRWVRAYDFCCRQQKSYFVAIAVMWRTISDNLKRVTLVHASLVFRNISVRPAAVLNAREESGDI